ncbi:MAG: saccharopine dehydrogenase, partial [Nocardia sp.]|nr:saccharopine dehydrogenase [Nocardia sp.]
VGGLNKIVKGSTGGPSPQALSRTRSWVVADASDASGRVLASQTLTGGDPYSFTAAILAWGARTALAGGLRATGALGPVDAFGLEALTEGVAASGFTG